jgi:hypothetical protein
MKVINHKDHLIAWLKSIDVDVEIRSIPDVKPIPKSKWQDQPHFLENRDFYAEGRYSNNAGDSLKMCLTLDSFENFYRIRPVRVSNFKGLNRFRHFTIKKSVFDSLSIKGICNLLTAKYKVNFSDERDGI